MGVGVGVRLGVGVGAAVGAYVGGTVGVAVASASIAPGALMMTHRATTVTTARITTVTSPSDKWVRRRDLLSVFRVSIDSAGWADYTTEVARDQLNCELSDLQGLPRSHLATSALSVPSASISTMTWLIARTVRWLPRRTATA